MKFKDVEVGTRFIYDGIEYKVLTKNKHSLVGNDVKGIYTHDMTEKWFDEQGMTEVYNPVTGKVSVTSEEVSTKYSLDDNVNSPSHYAGTYGVECIKGIRNALTKEEFLGYCKGNALKYVWREGTKNGLEDIEKAIVYLNFIKEERNGKSD